nr:MAG TPA: hypothetical protein [Caudoviricetes sp.]
MEQSISKLGLVQIRVAELFAIFSTHLQRKSRRYFFPELQRVQTSLAYFITLPDGYFGTVRMLPLIQAYRSLLELQQT